MALYLGIDGGGTGCRAALCDASGRILGQGQGGPANIASDPDTALANLMDVARQTLPQGVSLGDLHAVLGLAGANIVDPVTWLQPRLPFASALIKPDSHIALIGALQDGDGIVASLGTGSVFASQRGGVVRQVGGWGLVLGDEGSGARVGRQALSETLRAVDGFRAMTPLAVELLAELGGADGIVSFAQTARPADFAALAPRIAASPDPLAAEVMGLASGAVAAFITQLQGAAPLPVVFLGGLGAVYAERLAGRWQVRAPLGTPLDGALWLARQAG